MAEPTCPNCGVAGVESITSKESIEMSKTRQPWYLIVHCDQCGHVYDIIAKHVFSQPVAPKLVLPKLK